MIHDYPHTMVVGATGGYVREERREITLRQNQIRYRVNLGVPTHVAENLQFSRTIIH